MTEAEQKQAEKDAWADAETLGLLLLLAMRNRSSRELADVRFDAQRSRFILKGRAVSVTTIRMYLRRIEERLSGRILKQLNDLEAGRITETQWKRSFDRSITSSHILAGALALGGIGIAVRNSTVQRNIESEISFADKFAGAIRANNAGSIRKIRARAAQYFRAAHITFVNTQFELIKETGFYDEVRNRMRPAEHCQTSELAPPGTRESCPNISKWGWVELERMIPIGGRLCYKNCRCYLEYR